MVFSLFPVPCAALFSGRVRQPTYYNEIGVYLQARGLLRAALQTPETALDILHGFDFHRICIKCVPVTITA